MNRLLISTTLILSTATASCTHTAPGAIRDTVCESFERIDPVTFSSSGDSAQTVSEAKATNQAIVEHNAVLDAYDCP